MYCQKRTLLFHIMIKQGLTWFNLASNNPQEAVYDIQDILPEKWLAIWKQLATFSLHTFQVLYQRTQ